MLTLYDYLPSQNAYKVRLLLNHLRRPYDTKIISIFEGEGQSPDYLEISPVGAVPAIKLDDGRSIAESNAILTYLAEGSPYLPDDPFARAKIAQWLFFEGDYVQAGIASLRYLVLTGKDTTRPPDVIEAKRQISLKTLGILDSELGKNAFLGGTIYSIADMSVFAYVHLARDAKLPLDNFGHVLAWIERIKQQVGFLNVMHPYTVDPYSSGEL